VTTHGDTFKVRSGFDETVLSDDSYFKRLIYGVGYVKLETTRFVARMNLKLGNNTWDNWA